MIASVIVSVFIVFGLFSIAAGIMLIFLIFVMLAAERRAEMGMARAVGTRRAHLIQQFLFEGYVYNLGAALVGILLGILVSLGMARVMAALFGSYDFTIVGHIEPRSLVVSFCLGALVTFLTVAFSSYRSSRLNVVAAIRDLPESFGIKTNVGHAWALTGSRFARVLNVRRPLPLIYWVLGLVAAVLAPPAGITYLVLRLAWYCRAVFAAYFARGPLFLAIGIALIPVGIKTTQSIFFTLGCSLTAIGLAMLVRWILHAFGVGDPLRNRIGYSLAGVALVVYWLLPFDFFQRFGLPKLQGGIEMFFVSGIMLVIGAVWTVMFNADLIANGLMRLFGAAGSLGPVMKMAVTYPMQHKVRTGLTLAMFSLVIFTLMVMSVLTRSTAGSLVYDRDTGGFQIYGNPSQPVSAAGNAAVIAANPALRTAIVATGAIGQESVGVRQPGQSDQSFSNSVVNALDTTYLENTRFPLHSRALGYTSDAQIWQTLRTHPGYAVVDGTLVEQPSSNTMQFGAAFSIKGIKYDDKTFKAQTIEVHDTRSGLTIPLTVIGVLDQNATNNLPDLTQGIFTGENTFTAAGGQPIGVTSFVYRVRPGTDIHATALLLGKAFLSEGLDVKEAQKQFDQNQALGIGLNDLLEGFMALGLIVGIAALGVIAFRSVVERRQEIGMMRAIGFQRSMVRTAFLLESSFVAVLGTLNGVVLGLVLSYNLVASITSTNSAYSFSVPWLQIVVIVALAYVASLITTYLPAWQASRIYPAEALRYE